MRLVLGILVSLIVAAPAMAQDRAKVLENVVDCRKIADSAERLACFDKTVAELDTAERQKDVVVVDKSQVREARRSVFGLKLPRIKLFGGDDAGTDIEEIESKVVSIDRQGDGRVMFTIEDGARWMQTDDSTVVGVRPGNPVTLKRGTMGSFFAKFQGKTTVRVARVN